MPETKILVQPVCYWLFDTTSYNQNSHVYLIFKKKLWLTQVPESRWFWVSQVKNLKRNYKWTTTGRQKIENVNLVYSDYSEFESFSQVLSNFLFGITTEKQTSFCFTEIVTKPKINYIYFSLISLFFETSLRLF